MTPMNPGGASGLYVPGVPIGDLFWYVQPDDGVAYNGLRYLLFAAATPRLGVSCFPIAEGTSTLN